VRRAFSLIEVVIATVILSVVGLALLQMGSKNQAINAYIDKKTAIAPLASIVSFHHDKKFDTQEKSLYDFLKNSYAIDNDEVKAMLEERKIRYFETAVSTIDFGENNLSEGETPTQRFEIVRATVRYEEASANLYFLQYR
jgi:prepilin-type N-terminal cleavage/methylation domain-containing protein